MTLDHTSSGNWNALTASAISWVVAALTPIYFGRVGSFVIENRNVTTEEAEDRVERQARTFERTKPYLVERWKAARAAETAPGSEVTA